MMAPTGERGRRRDQRREGPDRRHPSADGGTGPTADDPMQDLGGNFLLAFYEALRTVKAYPIENAEVRQSLEEVASAAGEILDKERGLEARISGQLLYVNSSQLRLDLDNFASFGHVISTLSKAGIGWIRMEKSASSGEWKTFVSQLMKFAAGEPGENGIDEFRQIIRDRGVSSIEIGSPMEGEARFAGELERKRVAKQTYEQSVAVTKELYGSTRLGRSVHLKQMKHAVRSIVDQVLHNEVTSVGLTTLNDYDRYTFAHTVNVCIFSVAIGRRLGLSKSRLFDLGMAALLHDVGKSRVPLEIVSKEGELTEAEHAKMQAHTWLGALSVYRFRDYGEIPFRGMITAYEHHMKVDLSGYPKVIRPRTPSMFAKIVGAAAAFDAATSTRSYSAAKSPDVVLRELWDDPNHGHDPVLIKALINLLGIYPVGTCVILDTYELAIVHAANSDAAQVHRPIVRLICDADGVWLDEPPLVDLADTQADGSFSRSIIKVTDPDKYLIKVSDYFV